MTLVATALCADRTVASPNPRPQPDETAARTLVGKLTYSFRRVVPVVRFVEVRRDKDQLADASPALKAQLLPGHLAAQPFQFRLPPPVL